MCRELRSAARRRARRDRGDRVGLVRHARRPSAVVGHLAHLADLGWAIRTTSTAILATTPDAVASPPARSATGSRIVCQLARRPDPARWRVRPGRLVVLAERRASPTGPPSCTGRPAATQPGGWMRRRSRGASRRLRRERQRTGTLHEGATHDRMVAGGEVARGRVRPSEIGSDRADGVPRHQHQRGVENVLAGCSPVNGVGMRPGEALQLADERDHRVATGAVPRASLSRSTSTASHASRTAATAASSRSRPDPGPPPAPTPRAGWPRRRRHRRSARGRPCARRRRRTPRQTPKNTVSPSPCSTKSCGSRSSRMRHEGRAAVGLEAESTGSAALARPRRRSRSG